MGEAPQNSLELVVKIIDVRYNKEDAGEVLSRSEKLRGYSLLLNYVSLYREQGHNLKDAVEREVNRCIEENTLHEFLRKYAKEVKGMLYEDITIERFAEIRAEEQWEEGHRAGLAEGREAEQARMNMLNKLLIKAGRYDDLEKSTEDSAFQEELFKEFDL